MEKRDKEDVEIEEENVLKQVLMHIDWNIISCWNKKNVSGFHKFEVWIYHEAKASLDVSIIK